MLGLRRVGDMMSEAGATSTAGAAAGMKNLGGPAAPGAAMPGRKEEEVAAKADPVGGADAVALAAFTVRLSWRTYREDMARLKQDSGKHGQRDR